MDRIAFKKKLLKNYINSVNWVLDNWASKDQEKVDSMVKRIEKCEDLLTAMGLSAETLGQITQACRDKALIKKIFFKEEKQ